MSQSFDYRIRRADGSIALFAPSSGSLPAEDDLTFWVRSNTQVPSIQAWWWNAETAQLEEMSADQKNAAASVRSSARSQASQAQSAKAEALADALLRVSPEQRAAINALLDYLDVPRPS